jgi:hypothetical protein
MDPRGWRWWLLLNLTGLRVGGPDVHMELRYSLQQLLKHPAIHGALEIFQSSLRRDDSRYQFVRTQMNLTKSVMRDVENKHKLGAIAGNILINLTIVVLMILQANLS